MIALVIWPPPGLEKGRKVYNNLDTIEIQYEHYGASIA